MRRLMVVIEQPQGAKSYWQEVLDESNQPRGHYAPLCKKLDSMQPREVRVLADRLESTFREMGVSFLAEHENKWKTRPWVCDVLPQVFTSAEWDLVERGLRQRLLAFELFLRDIYGKKQILRDRIIPHAPVLGSPYYQPAASGLVPPDGHYLHLCGICLSRDLYGRLVVKNHYFSHASGISYMLQNRRALARVNPALFEETAIELISSTPMEILDQLKVVASHFSNDPFVVLLTPGIGSAAFSEHTLLARRMGIQLVEGGDLLVLNDHVYLKSVGGLERVDVIYTRVADSWLDPMVFRQDSTMGVPGLLHCIRKGTVAVINSIGCQLADDRSLLEFSPQIIRYYLGEHPLLATLPTRWLGDFDVCEMVFENPEGYRVRPLYGERIPGRLGRELTALSKRELAKVRNEVFSNPQGYVVQSVEESADSICYVNGRKVTRAQDHIVFALRTGEGYRVFPGALTRVSMAGNRQTSSELGGGSKDTWVLSDKSEPDPEHLMFRRPQDLNIAVRRVTSRVAEMFYWLGRYLERAQNLCYMIGVIETLETEELNAAERRLYRPVWNKLLPPLEPSHARSRRSIANWQDRYRILLSPDQMGSAVQILGSAFANARGLQDSLSPEAWSVLASFKAKIFRIPFKEEGDEVKAQRDILQTVELVTQFIPQFFAVAQDSMLADDGWRFCAIGQMLERGVTTAHAVVSMTASLASQSQAGAEFTTAEEIELSAFLRLLGSRDAYRRVYQMRAAPAEVLEILWQNPESPRSVARCLRRCATLLRESLGLLPSQESIALRELNRLLAGIERIDWYWFFLPEISGEDLEVSQEWLEGMGDTGQERSLRLVSLLEGLRKETLGLHEFISDGFLSHQETITGELELNGIGHAV